MEIRVLAVLIFVAACAAAPAVAAQKAANASAAVTRMTQKYTGDLGPKTRAIRVLVHYGRTTFYVSSGNPRGYEYDLMREFEAFYNKEMRKLAAERGFDPNRWFYNVELVTQEKVGAEPVEYVANIHRYYMAYRLSDRLEAEDDAIRKASKEKTR